MPNHQWLRDYGHEKSLNMTPPGPLATTFTVNVANIHLHSLEFCFYSLERACPEVRDGSMLVRRAPLAFRMVQVQPWGP